MTLSPFKNKHEQRFGGFIIIIVGILIIFFPSFTFATISFPHLFTLLES